MIHIDASLAIQRKNIILVEGPDDADFFDGMARAEGRDQDIEIFVAGGKDKIRGLLRSLVGFRGFEDVMSVTLFRDANGDPDSAADSCRGAFGRASLNVPSVPLTLTTSVPSCGYGLTPHEGPGCLETLLLAGYPNDAILVIAHRYICDVDAADLATPEVFSLTDIEKRRLYPLLAVGMRNPRKVDPAINVRVAIQKQLWDWSHSVFEPYRMYLKNLP